MFHLHRTQIFGSSHPNLLLCRWVYYEGVLTLVESELGGYMLNQLRSLLPKRKSFVRKDHPCSISKGFRPNFEGIFLTHSKAMERRVTQRRCVPWDSCVAGLLQGLRRPCIFGLLIMASSPFLESGFTEKKPGIHKVDLDWLSGYNLTYSFMSCPHFWINISFHQGETKSLSWGYKNATPMWAKISLPNKEVGLLGMIKKACINNRSPKLQLRSWEKYRVTLFPEMFITVMLQEEEAWIREK